MPGSAYCLPAHGPTGTFGYVTTDSIPAPFIDILNALLKDKGDIITWDGTQFLRQSVGGDGQVLTADSSETDGMTWAAIPPNMSAVATAKWLYKTPTADADPGPNNFRLNDAVQADATFAFISDIDDSNCDDAVLLRNLAINGRIYLQQIDDSSRFHSFDITGTPTIAAGYTKVPIITSSSGGDIVDGKSTLALMMYGQAAQLFP